MALFIVSQARTGARNSQGEVLTEMKRKKKERKLNIKTSMQKLRAKKKRC